MNTWAALSLTVVITVPSAALGRAVGNRVSERKRSGRTAMRVADSLCEPRHQVTSTLAHLGGRVVGGLAVYSGPFSRSRTVEGKSPHAVVVALTLGEAHDRARLRLANTCTAGATSRVIAIGAGGATCAPRYSLKNGTTPPPVGRRGWSS